MKKGILLKATSTIVATALVATSVLIYVDKKSANASKKVASSTTTVDGQINEVVNSIEEVSVKGNTTTYTMDVEGEKVTYKVTDTATGRKVVQTNNKTNEFNAFEMNNDGIMTFTTGEVKDGKYIATSADQCDVDKEAEKVEEENKSTSTRVTCLALGNSLWYENEETNVNIGKSKGGKDIEKKSIELAGLDKKDTKNVENYQKFVGKAAKNWSKVQENLTKVATELTLEALVGVLGFLAAKAPFFTTVLKPIIFVIGILLLFKAIPTFINSVKIAINCVNGLRNSSKAKNLYTKIAVLGKDY